MMELMGWVIGVLLIAATVFVHYETMLMVSDRVMPWAQKRFHKHRIITALVIGMLLLGHIAEIWLFAFTYMAMNSFSDSGTIAGGFDGSLNSYLTFSTVRYTSVGDPVWHAQGWLASVSATETLVGLMMIGWSTSFTILKMEQLWRDQHK